MAGDVAADLAVPPLVAPGRAGGPTQVFRRHYLLRLVVRRELRRRYQGSLLGLGWSYVRPAAQFCVYFFVVGIFLNLNKAIPDFPIYLFAGLVLISFFTETLITATWSVIGNRALVQKVQLPREVFPIASMLVSAFHMLPGLGILLAGALVAGWSPSLLGLGSAVLALLIVIVLATAFGLLFAAVNVFFRDFGQVVDILSIVIPWTAPMIYPWTAVRAATGDGGLLQLYLANPLTTAVSLFHRAFWWSGVDGPARPGGPVSPFPDHLTERGLGTLAAAAVLLALSWGAFTRLQRRFAQEL
jgi:ABC-2 type transport system permease protein